MRKTASELELDMLLAQWAERNALPPVRAAVIRLAARTPAIASPQEVGPSSDWWKQLFHDVSHAVRFSTDARRYLPTPTRHVL